MGWLYEWNTGALVQMWKAEVCEDIIYEQYWIFERVAHVDDGSVLLTYLT